MVLPWKLRSPVDVAKAQDEDCAEHRETKGVTYGRDEGWADKHRMSIAPNLVSVLPQDASRLLQSPQRGEGRTKGDCP